MSRKVKLEACGYVDCLICSDRLRYTSEVSLVEKCSCGNLEIHNVFNVCDNAGVSTLYDKGEEHQYSVKPDYYHYVGKRTIVVDLDKTLAENDFPFIGKENVDLIKHLHAQLLKSYKVILFTCRLNPDIVGGQEEADWHKGKIREWLDLHGLQEVTIWEHKKPYGVVYWDDKSVNPRGNQVVGFLE